MNGSSQLILRARTLLPISRPPLENGAVVIDGNRIKAVGAWTRLRVPGAPKVLDFGDAVLLPGLVNAHCHLDYSDMAGMLPPPKTFTDWIPLILAAKSAWGYSDYLRSWLNGAQMLVRSGTTTVADIETVPDLLPDAWEATPLRVFSFLEMTGIRARRQPVAILHEAVEKIESLAHPRSSASLGPHAPYSTLPELLRLSAEAARRRQGRWCTHVAESDQEFEMFRHARGEMFKWLQRNERDMSDCGSASPVRLLARLRLLDDNLIAVHVNALARGDAALLGRGRVHVVHCPRSHAYFGHPRFQHRALARAGANLCLGTDSLASIRRNGRQKPELNMFEEMQTLAHRAPDLSPTTILRMATINGARALDRAGQIGQLAPGALADLVVIPARTGARNAAETIVHHAGTPNAVMIDGEWAVPPAGWLTPQKP